MIGGIVGRIGGIVGTTGGSVGRTGGCVAGGRAVGVAGGAFVAGGAVRVTTVFGVRVGRGVREGVAGEGTVNSSCWQLGSA